MRRHAALRLARARLERRCQVRVGPRDGAPQPHHGPLAGFLLCILRRERWRRPAAAIGDARTAPRHLARSGRRTARPDR
eukprot:6459715-Prymnesium_polylepis.1